MSVYFLQSCISYLLLTNHIRAQTVEIALQTFSDQLTSIMCEEGLNVGGTKCGGYGIQDFISTFESHFVDATEDVSTLANTITDRLNKKLNLRAAFLKNMSYVIRAECNEYGNTEGDESINDFDNLYFAGNKNKPANLPNGMEYSDVYENTVTFTASTFKIPNGVDYTLEDVQQDAQISELVGEKMVDLHETFCVDDDGSKEYCVMYFGTINGVFTQFPGSENTKTNDVYNDYDPRFRPWYVSAASGSKDVVILLDISGSMRDHNRIGLAKEALISVLNTLGSSSFVNIVAFSDTITLTCFENQLVPATGRNIAELVSFVDNLNAGGYTNFTIAFNAAFDILSNGKSCETSILFLTDGIADDVSALIEKRNTIDVNAVVFSFTLGNDADATVPKKVASMTNGIYTHINDNDENLITAMSSYYLYYAYGGSDEAEDESIIITSPYFDFDTSVIMVTMAMPVYFNSSYFVGVVGVDIPLRFLSDAIGDITIGRKSYSFVMNGEAELLLHPLIPDAFALFGGDEYKPWFVNDVEPEELNTTGTLQKMLKRESGSIKIESTVKQPAGNVEYNGYVYEEANLLYIYAPVGPSSLAIAIVVYSEDNVDAPNVPSFGMKSSPNTDCNENITENNIASEMNECLAPFNMFHRLDIVKECNSSWSGQANLLNGSDGVNSQYPWESFYEGKLYSPDHPIYYLQSGLFEGQYDALNIDPSCDAIEELHKLTNRQGSVNANKLPFGGFRDEIASDVLNAIYTLTSIHEFWKPAWFKTDSLFVSLWFGHYQGLHISYPGKQFSNTYNNLIRPWYQRALSYPQQFVWTTPYKHATTGKLVTGGNTVLKAPYSDYAYGVAGFNIEYQPFVDYWHGLMGAVCDQNNKDYCFLVDSSAFLLYYEGMENLTDEEDISRKFLGDIEPTLMQSLLDRGFFVKEVNVNFQSDTTDVTYIIDQSAFSSGDFSTQMAFTSNTGEYTVYAVSKTNLFVIYVSEYHATKTYPNGCPDHSDCTDVTSPGCIENNQAQCASAAIDVCVKADSTVSIESNSGTADCSVISALGICVLKSDLSSDMCASNFIDISEECAAQESAEEGTAVWVIALVAVLAGLCCVGIMIVVFCKFKSRKSYAHSAVKNEGGNNVQLNNYSNNRGGPPPGTNPAYYYN